MRHPIYYLNHFNCNCFNVFITNTDRSIIFQCFFIQIPLSHKCYILLWWKWLFNSLMGILQICIIEMPNVSAQPFKNPLDKVFVLAVLVMFQFCRRFKMEFIWNVQNINLLWFQLNITHSVSNLLPSMGRFFWKLFAEFEYNFLINSGIVRVSNVKLSFALRQILRKDEFLSWQT